MQTNKTMSKCEHMTVAQSRDVVCKLRL